MNSYEIIDLTSETPDVSVAMLTYNHEKFIAQAIESVLMQETEYNFKIILADDKSTDSTRKIILEYQRKYPEKIKLILQNTNVGATKNNISLLENIEGLYIAALEGDDYWIDPLKLQKQIDFLENNPDCGLLYTDFDRLNQETGFVEQAAFKNTLGIKINSFEDFLVEAWFIAPCTWVFRSSFIEIIQNNLHKNFVVGDLPIVLTISPSSKICYLPDVTTCYRVLKKSASHLNSLNEIFEFQKGILDIQLFFAKQNEVSTEIYEKVQQNFYKRTFPTLCKIGDKKMIKEAFKYLRHMHQTTFKMKMLFYFSKNRFIYNTSDEFYKFFRDKKILNK